MISKKDFEEIAKILARDQTQTEIINSVVQYCKMANPNFNESKFRNKIAKLRGC
jgi:hypothetical protein